MNSAAKFDKEALVLVESWFETLTELSLYFYGPNVALVATCRPLEGVTIGLRIETQDRASLKLLWEASVLRPDGKLKMGRFPTWPEEFFAEELGAMAQPFLLSLAVADFREIYLELGKRWLELMGTFAVAGMLNEWVKDALLNEAVRIKQGFADDLQVRLDRSTAALSA